MTEKRKISEFVPISDVKNSTDTLYLETVKSVGVKIGGKEIDYPKHISEDGKIDLKEYSPEYLFFLRRCVKCPKHCLEKADPRTEGFRDYYSSKVVPDKYKDYYDPRTGYYSPMLKKDLAETLPIEVTCSDCLIADETLLDPTVLIEKELLDCNENLPEGYETGKDYYLAFKRNYNFFLNLLPIIDKFKEISHDDYEFLYNNFNKYSFGVGDVVLIKNGIILPDPTNTYAMRPAVAVGWDTPVLTGTMEDIRSGYESFTNNSAIEKVISKIIDSVEDRFSDETGEKYISIDDKVVIKVMITTEDLTIASGYSYVNLNNVVCDPCCPPDDLISKANRSVTVSKTIEATDPVIHTRKYSLVITQICQ